MNNFIKFSDSAQKVLNYAGEITKKMKGNQIDSEHLLYGILSVPTSLACRMLKDENVTFRSINDSNHLECEYVYAFPYSFNNLEEEVVEEIVNAKSNEADIVGRYELYQAYFNDTNSLTSCYKDPSSDEEPSVINTDNCEGIITILSNEYVKMNDISVLLKDLYNADIEIKKDKEPLINYSDQLYNLITKDIICQDEHIKAIVTSLAKNQRITNEKLKDNLLVCGPTGVGKSEIFNCIKENTEIPISIDDSYQFTQDGAVMKSISDMLYELYINADKDISRAERGIIVIDGLDKKIADSAQPELFASYLESLIKVSEGCKYQIQTSEEEFEIDTSFISFVFTGNFKGIDKLSEQCCKMGYSSENRHSNDAYKEKLIVKYGLKKEFLDSVKLINLNSLNKNDLHKILNESEISILLLYKNFYEELGINFIYDDKCTEAIAKKALELGIGAKGIKKVLDYALELINYELFSNNNYSELTIFPETVDDNKKFILK